MNKKDLKKFLIENESHTIENTEEKLLSFVKGTMLRMVFKTPVKPEWRERCAAGTMAS